MEAPYMPDPHQMPEADPSVAAEIKAGNKNSIFGKSHDDIFSEFG
jgi:hypothetical protein